MKPYDLWGREYHTKRTDPRTSFWNDQLDYPAVKRLLKGRVKGRRILDLGCGSGLFTRKLCRWGGEVIGLDHSRTLLEIARRENPQIRFVVAEATRMPFAGRTFDLVSSNLVIHYLKNLSPVFREVARVLRPKGCFIFSFHHPVNEVMKLEGKIPVLTPYFHDRAYGWRMLGRKMRSFHHTFENIFTELSRHGFQVEHLLEPTPSRSSRRIDPGAYRLTSRYPSFCAIRAVRARE
jgi:ubiquinone/menaquinone biosynthesis C-methylase UbiE